MILGIKVGLQKQSFFDIEQSNAPFAEVWFDVNRQNEYTGLFTLLKKRNVQVGLHFWGALPDGTWTNIAYPDTELNNASTNLIKRAIDVASIWHFQYVNIHPGSMARLSIDLKTMAIRIMAQPVALKIAQDIFLDSSKKLSKYAKNRNVVFTVETVPARLTNWSTKEKQHEAGNIRDGSELPIGAIESAAASGIAVANDFGHTAAILADKPTDIWGHLKEKTQTLAPFTRLIHLGYVLPPYNGTDAHDHLDNPHLLTDAAIPNRLQMIELLKLFDNRPDVWILCEPDDRHVQNYFLAKKILTDAGVLSL